MRPDPKGGELAILIGYIMMIVLAYTIDACESEPRDNIKKSCAKTILDDAHKQATASVDTLNLYEYRVDSDKAREDSARLATEMLGWMKYQGENPRFCDYKQVYNTVDMGNGQTGFKLSKNMWYINVSKAMKDPCFAKTYNQYCKTIKQLEIARRQNKYKIK